MASSQLTKEALAASLKKLMKEHPFSKIHVKMITDDCHLTRHSFYTHYRDIYDLLGKMYEYELIRELDNFCDSKNWKSAVLLVLNYTLENKQVCINTFKSVGRDHLETFVYKTFLHILQEIIKDILERELPEERSIDLKFQQQISEFYSNAVTGIFIGWMKNNMQEKPAVIADWIEFMVSNNLSQLIKNCTN